MARKGRPYQDTFGRHSALIGKIPRGGYGSGGPASKEGRMPQGLIGRAFGKGKAGLREAVPAEQLQREARMQRLGVPVRYQRMTRHHAATTPYVPIDDFRTFGGEHAKRPRGYPRGRPRKG